MTSSPYPDSGFDWSDARQMYVRRRPERPHHPQLVSLEDEESLARWRADPVAFVEEVLVNPETGEPFVLYDAQKRFLRQGFTLGEDGRLLFPELVYGAPKKSGKTATAAMSMLYVVVVLGGPFAEGYCVANDFEQAQGRVFQACARIVEASPALASQANVTAKVITFTKTGATIVALASDYASAAGGNPTISTFDELWGYTSERAHRLWDEMVPPPTRLVACRLTTTYAGFENESVLLEGLYRRAKAGAEVSPDLFEAPGLLAFWTHEPPAPWQTPEWVEQMRGQLRPNAFLRMIENRFVSSESSFVDMDDWAACVDDDLSPVLEDRKLTVFGAVDASTKRDHTAITVTAYDGDTKKVRLVAHRTFKPTSADPLDFERTVEAEVLSLSRRFKLREVRYDPYQMHASAGRLRSAGINMVEFPQTGARLEAMGSNLFDLVTGRNLRVYRSDELSLAVSRAIALETARGWRIAKEKSSHKIDLVVSLAMAALATVEWAADGAVRDAKMAAAIEVGPQGIGKQSILGGYGQNVGTPDRQVDRRGSGTCRRTPGCLLSPHSGGCDTGERRRPVADGLPRPVSIPKHERDVL